MPLDVTTLNRHLGRILGDLPVQFVHKGRAYGPAGVTRGPISEDQRLMAGGLDLKLDSNLYVQASVLYGATIAVGDPIAIGTDQLKAHDVRKSADNAQLLIITLSWARR
jgi:hypothetical protein